MQARRLAGYRPLHMQMESFEIAETPAPGKMLVETKTTVVSAGTEIANYRGMTTYRSISQPDWSKDPYFPGYSVAGVVRAVGEGVAKFQVGDRVCGMGPHASVVEVEPSGYVRIPDEVSFDLASMTTLVCIVTNSVRLAKIELGEKVAVVGQGLIGQLAAQLTRISGARPVVGIDPIASRLELSKKCGASAVVDPTSPDASQQYQTLTDGKMFDVVFEATGSPPALTPALKLADFMGRVVLLGSTRGLVEQFDPYTDVHLNGVTVIGAHMRTHPAQESPFNPWTYENNRRLGLRLIADGSLRMDPLISHRVSAEEGPAMFDRLANSRESFYGVLLDWTK